MSTIITKTIKTEPQQDFLMVADEAWMAAVRDLKYSSFILWLYCSQYQDGDKFILSPKAIKEILGMSERTYTRCKDELIEKGYLVKVGDNQYMFYEMPRN